MFVTIERRRPKTSKSRSLEQQVETDSSADILSSSMPDLENFIDSAIPPKPLPRRPKPLPRQRAVTQTPPKPAPRVPRVTKVVLRKLHDRPISVSRYIQCTCTYSIASFSGSSPA